MANYSTLKGDINDTVKTNGSQSISGAALNTILNEMVTSLGAGYNYMGVAVPTTNPGTPDPNVFYLASQAGTYTNFGGLVVNEGEVCALVYNGSWSKQVTGAATQEQLSQLGQSSIIDVILSESFQYSNIVSGNDGVTSADILWPDGATGVMAVTYSNGLPSRVTYSHILDGVTRNFEQVVTYTYTDGDVVANTINEI